MSKSTWAISGASNLLDSCDEPALEFDKSSRRQPERPEALAAGLPRVAPRHHDAAPAQPREPVLQHLPDPLAHARAHPRRRIHPGRDLEHARGEKAAEAVRHIPGD